MKTFRIVILVLILSTFGFGQQSKNRTDFRKYFDAYKVTGTFVLFDLKLNKSIRYNPKRARTRFTPASTFKILNSLIGLETGEIVNEQHVFRWDGTEYSIKNWNQDLVLKDAFQFSCVPCYRDLARKIGAKTMKKWVRKIGYGNRDISGGVDQFWLGSTLKISPNQQIEFLRRLYQDRLPFSAKNQKIVKKIMLVEETSRYRLYSKTGWGITRDRNIGWYLGFLEQNENVYFFVNNIEAKDADNEFGISRIEITRKILRDLSLL